MTPIKTLEVFGEIVAMSERGTLMGIAFTCPWTRRRHPCSDDTEARTRTPIRR